MVNKLHTQILPICIRGLLELITYNFHKCIVQTSFPPREASINTWAQISNQSVNQTHPLRMKFVISLVAAVIFAVAVQETLAIKCRTGFVTLDCNSCTCNKENGKLGFCTLRGCPDKPPTTCSDGEEKMNESSVSCECEDNQWYCDKQPATH